MVGVVILGDSLTAGLGLLVEESFPSRLQMLFVEEGYEEVEIMNAGVSGDTTAGGLRRVDSVLTPEVRIAVVALGGNDALRGLSVADTRQNLKGIIDRFLDSGVSVLLAGMEGPTNLGEDYRTSFRNTFHELAAEYRGSIRFLPFLLEGVAGMPALNQSDGIHPNAEGAQKIAQGSPEVGPLPFDGDEDEDLPESFSPLEAALFPGEETTVGEYQIFPRLGAWLADCSILSVILLAFVVMGKLGLDAQPHQGLFPTQAALLVELLIPYFFLLFVLCFGYFTVFHFLTGQTPGKMLFNIRVEDENGFPLLFSQAFLHSAGGLLSFLLLGFGYLMIFFNPERRGWNDRLAGTRVVRVEPQK